MLDDTASARSLPDLRCGIGAVPAIEPIGGSPPSTAAAAGPAPRNGTCVISTLARTLKRFSAVRCGVVPLEGEAKASFCVRAICSSSARVRAGNAALTTMKLGCDATTATAMKSFSGL